MGGVKQAVFLDRDGILTRPVWNATTLDYEAPKDAGAVELIEEVVSPLWVLREAGFLLVVISNQPDIAKGKMTRAALTGVEERFAGLLGERGIEMDGIYYCHHHPQGTVAELAVPCECRKPAPGLVLRACRDLGIVARRSWFVGDRDTDVQCGRAAGCRTILVRSVEAGRPGWGNSAPDYVADNLADAVKTIVEHP